MADGETQNPLEQDGSELDFLRPLGLSDKRWAEISHQCLIQNTTLNATNVNKIVNGAAKWAGVPTFVGAVLGGAIGCVAGSETGCLPGAIGGAVLGARIGAGAGFVGWGFLGRPTEQQTSEEECVARKSEGIAKTAPQVNPVDVSRIAEHTRAGTVHIYTPNVGSGLGFLIDPGVDVGAHSCVIVTDNHVISRSSEIAPSSKAHDVLFHNSDRFSTGYKGTVLYQDEKNDLAYLRVDGVDDPSITCKAVLPLGDAENAREVPIPVISITQSGYSTGATMGITDLSKFDPEQARSRGNRVGLKAHINGLAQGDSGGPIVNAQDGTALLINQHAEFPSLIDGFLEIPTSAYNFGPPANIIKQDLEIVKQKLVREQSPESSSK